MKCKLSPPNQLFSSPVHSNPIELQLVLTCARDVDSDRGPSVAGPSSVGSRDSNALAVVVRDSTNWLSNMRNLQETDVIILLTPVVIPISQDPTDISDPFEPLGRSLARRHARVRQVPYTQRFA